jgi:hypothetical protein
MRAHLRLSLHVEILTIGSTRLFLRNLVNRLIIAFLSLSPLLVAYVLVVYMHILIKKVLNNYCILLMILFVHENYYFRGIC